ncbi:MAG: hypothetical protein DHS20C21_24290 [Gemmatimonadota bacterium]|nr:MAG: hypothetical protein DHS20C21_24290 [Gemmatimonadota bacterium]
MVGMTMTDAQTTMLARRAMHGESEALNGIIERFDPTLTALARHKLRGPMAAVCDPEDLVADVWVRALPRLGDLEPRDGRITPVIMRFLSTTLVNRYNTILQKHVIGKPGRVDFDAPEDDLSASITQALGRLERDERRNAVHAAISQLAESDRELVFLRAIQQIPNQEVATLLDVSPGALKVRYHRALKKLRALLPGSIFADIEDE